MQFNRRHFITSTAAAGALMALGQTPGQAAAARSATGKKKMLFDTDIGSDIDDAIALTYLLAQPQCDLLGITTVSGEPVKRAEMASAICRIAGRPDIPIFPGAAEPLVGAQRQPLVPQYAAMGGHSHETKFPEGEAIEFMRRTIRANPGEITLLAVGPMTNVALLFRTDPEIPRLLKEVVLMCGKFGAKKISWGEMEWNATCDPEATAIVYRSAPPMLRSYGLDVTIQVTMPREEVAKRFSRDPRLRLVLDFAQVWFAKQDKIYFHDPLAAVNVFVPGICGMERGTVTVDLKDGPEKGRTLWQPGTGDHQEVASTVDAARFFAEYFGEFGA
ncbi:MAG TPA: nucleoside hydrolase [Lacunisphaera sp.]|jgi:inosine-uridine nucleoside N-ribohydrolase